MLLISFITNLQLVLKINWELQQSFLLYKAIYKKWLGFGDLVYQNSNFSYYTQEIHPLKHKIIIYYYL